MISSGLLGFLSIAIAASGYGIYILSIIRGRTHPHILSWVTWGLASAVIFVVQITKQEGAGSWAVGFSAFVCLLIAALAVRYGERNITGSDKISFGLALASIPLWLLTRDPLYAVILLTATDVLGFYPTFRKSLSKPFEENALMYNLDVLKFSFSLLAMQEFNLASVLYPIFAIFLNLSFVMMLFVQRRRIPFVLHSAR